MQFSCSSDFLLPVAFGRFKVYDGKLHQIEAVLDCSPGDMGSGWSTRPETMSDKAR